MTDVVVATTFVSEAMSKIVSAVIASGDGTTARRPNAFWYTRALPPDEHDGAGQPVLRDRIRDRAAPGRARRCAAPSVTRGRPRADLGQDGWLTRAAERPRRHASDPSG